MILYQINHRVATNIQRRIYGQTTDVAIRPLDEEKAVKTAAALLQIIMFTVILYIYDVIIKLVLLCIDIN